MKSTRVGSKLVAVLVAAGVIVGPASAEANTIYPYQQAVSGSGGAVTQTQGAGNIPFSVETGRKVH